MSNVFNTPHAGVSKKGTGPGAGRQPKYQPEPPINEIPVDAKNLEVFAIKEDEQGNRFAYIGFTISNGNFHFIAVPFTEPKPTEPLPWLGISGYADEV